MIRNRLYYEIIGILEKSQGFLKSDFQVEILTPATGQTIVLIIYKHEPKYQFEFQIPETSGEGGQHIFNCKTSPGVVLTKETFCVRNESNLLSGIKTWVNCVWEELSTQPFLKSAKMIEENINTVCTKFAGNEAKYFSSEETDEIKTHLERLEQDFKVEIKEEIKEKKEAWQKMGVLSREIENLKKDLHLLTRPSWLNLFFHTTYNLLG